MPAQTEAAAGYTRTAATNHNHHVLPILPDVETGRHCRCCTELWPAAVEHERQTSWALGREYAEARLIGGIARVVSDGATDKPSESARILVRRINATAARRAQHDATPVGSTWSEDNPLPVRHPGESADEYQRRYAQAARTATAGVAA